MVDSKTMFDEKA